MKFKRCGPWILEGPNQYIENYPYYLDAPYITAKRFYIIQNFLHVPIPVAWPNIPTGSELYIAYVACLVIIKISFNFFFFKKFCHSEKDIYYYQVALCRQTKNFLVYVPHSSWVSSAALQLMVQTVIFLGITSTAQIFHK